MKKRIAIMVAVLIAILGGIVWFYLLRQVPTDYADEVENFYYGSVGVEAANGAPYWIWYVLPRVCADRPPGRVGYEPYGFVWEEGREGPIGFPVMTVGFKRIGINCALCHIGTMRESDGGERRLYPGGTTPIFDLQGYLRFLFSCADSPRFDPDEILAAIAEVHELPFIEKLLYRRLVIPQMQKTLREQKLQLAWMEQTPDWGPGRSDPFNPAKGQILGLPPDGTIGNATVEPLWNFADRRGFGMHWDGLNSSRRPELEPLGINEIILNSGIGNGANAKTVDIDNLRRLQAWFEELESPAYPFAVDRALADAGGRVWEAECARCHALGGELTGRSVPIDELGTDRERLRSWSRLVAERFNGLDEYDWRYTGFRHTYGYNSVLLDGVWSRAPYLHNGSVPTLAALLAPPEERPAVFWTGYDVYDQERLGFVADGPEAERQGWRFDTSVRGNSNAGHLYGTGLPDEDKRALLEYLKTL